MDQFMDRAHGKGRILKEIILTNGAVALIDAQDFEVVSQHRWYINPYGYAVTARGVFMHRLIMGQQPKGIEIDHIDHNPLNNRRSNLRPATKSQQGMNKVKVPGKSSKYKGVSLRKNKGDWESYIKINKKRIHLGVFKSEEEAAYAYDESAKTLFGEFALLNFPEAM